MKAKAKLHDIGIDFHSRKVEATFLLEGVAPEQLEDMAEDDLQISVVKYRRRKTLSQNNYFWSLMQSLADYIKDGSSRWGQYLRCLKEYGIFAYYPAQENDIPMLEGVFRIVIDRGEIDLTTESGKVVTVHQMQCYKGISMYNTEEMSNLIDKVVLECKECGIDTDTPEQLDYLRSFGL